MRVKCCGVNQTATNYIIDDRKFELSIMAVLNPCRVCDKFVVRIEAFNHFGEKIECRKEGADAIKMFDEIKSSGRIICKLKASNFIRGRGGWYLHYYDKGKKLKCYSNLSNLRLGLTDTLQGLPDADKLLCGAVTGDVMSEMGFRG